MADKGIPFSSALVRAIIAGEKDQTRRMINPQPPQLVTSAAVISRSGEGQTDEWTWLSGDPEDLDTWECEGEFGTGYKPGDRLWVREAVTRVGGEVAYLADGVIIPDVEWVWKPRTLSSRYMPKGLSRMWIEIAGVNVERIQEITDADIWGECNIDRWAADYLDAKHGPGNGGKFKSIRAAWECLWDGLHAKPGERWADNPFVTVIRFGDVQKGNILSA